MRAYSAESEEALLARDLLKDWAGEGFISESQFAHMEQETVCELRRTNIFLRVVLFLFTLIIAGAALRLFFVVFFPRGDAQTTGVFLLIFAAISYTGAELAVSRARLYRFGIEEALIACSVGFFCFGLQDVFFIGRVDGTGFVVPAAGALASLWIWLRFGLPYSFPAAMIFVLWLPHFWTSSHWAQHLVIAAIYAAGLIVVAAVPVDTDSVVEALLWLGIYIAINLQLSSVNLLGQWWGGPRAPAEFPGTFYWFTWVLIWCLPPAVLVRGLRRRDRLVIAVGAIGAVLTLATNKPYLGWERHTWDPMLLGALLIGVALFVRRWLAGGPGGVRHGFTAQRLSGEDKRWMNAGSAAIGLAMPHLALPNVTTPGSPEVRFGGGDTGGGGASSDF